MRSGRARQLASSDVVAYLRSLPSLFADSGPGWTPGAGDGIVRAQFTPDAIELGLGAALAAVFGVGKERKFGRGERDS